MLKPEPHPKEEKKKTGVSDRHLRFIFFTMQHLQAHGPVGCWENPFEKHSKGKLHDQFH